MTVDSPLADAVDMLRIHEPNSPWDHASDLSYAESVATKSQLESLANGDASHQHNSEDAESYTASSVDHSSAQQSSGSGSARQERDEQEDDFDLDLSNSTSNSPLAASLASHSSIKSDSYAPADRSQRETSASPSVLSNKSRNTRSYITRAKGSPTQTQRRVFSNGSPGASGDHVGGLLDGHSASSDRSNASVASTNARQIVANDYISPLDDIDILLPGTSATPPSTTRTTGEAHTSPSSQKQGILSFDNDSRVNGNRGDDYSSEERSSSELNVSPFANREKSFNGVRRKQMVTHKLETENMELRLKLQQYREMNASAQEMARAKHQLLRSERRIDELEQALERKNQTIRELCEQRDSAIEAVQSQKNQELYDTISELQAAITQLEEESNQAQKNEGQVISQLHTDLPDIVPQKAGIPELSDAIRHLADENSKLTSLASSASSLKSQHTALKDLLAHAGKPGDPLLSVRELVNELVQATEDARLTRDAFNHENRKLKRELESMQESYEYKLHELEEVSNRFRVKAEKEAHVTEELELKLADFEKLLTDLRSASYSIIRKFFAELFDILGADFQETVERQLEDIMHRAQKEGLSKIPLLTDLLVSYTRKLGEAAIKAQEKPQQDRKMWALERELQSLEHMLEMKWDKAGADSVLKAQLRDLKKQLKLEEEKRKSEWMEYQYSLKNNHA